MEKKNVPYSVDRKGYHLYICEVQAYVCTQCGEKYFDEHEVDVFKRLSRPSSRRLKN